MIKNKKGYVLTWDALLALIIIFITLATLLTMGYLGGIGISSESNFERLHFIGEDALDVLNKNGVLEEIIENWAQNKTENASKLADTYFKNLSLIPTQFGYRLEIEGENISERTEGISENSATTKTRVIRFLSGYKENETEDVFVSRAWLLSNDTDINKTYTLESVPYGNSFKFALGGNWTINHLGGVSKVCIPENCSGDDEHEYKSTCDDPQNEDALDDATYRLLDKLDTDDNCVINRRFDSENMTFKTSSVSTKQSGELIEVKLIVWI